MDQHADETHPDQTDQTPGGIDRRSLIAKGAVAAGAAFVAPAVFSSIASAAPGGSTPESTTSVPECTLEPTAIPDNGLLFTSTGTFSTGDDPVTIRVHAWGAGGGGAGGTYIFPNFWGGGAGGGGAYATDEITLDACTTYDIIIGTGGNGAGRDVSGQAGGASYLTPQGAGVGSALVRAAGGAGGLSDENGPGGAGGTTAASIGSTIHAGGKGGNGGNSLTGGGGGGGAGAGGAGNAGQDGRSVAFAPATGGTGGAASGGLDGGGAGGPGNWNNTDTPGPAGNAIGGGGGGGRRAGLESNDVPGGAGARGQVLILKV